MNTSDTCVISCFRQVALLDREHDVALVQHSVTGRIYVRKKLSIYNMDVYRYLRDHPVKGTPAILELVREDDSLIVIEEYIAGETLRSILDDGNLFAVYDAVRLIQDLCRILHELHLADPPIIHRDIKPSNIIVTSNDSICLLDMNAAKFASAGKAEDTSMLGTFGYAAPEQFGFGSSSVQTDIYSIGVLLCEMITGHLPKEVLPKGEIGEIIQKCTRIDPKDRYKSVDDLLSALSSFLRSCDERDTTGTGISTGAGTSTRTGTGTGTSTGTGADTSTGTGTGTGAGASDFSLIFDPAASPGPGKNFPQEQSSANPAGPVHPNAIPGFRTGNPSNMITGGMGYLLLFYFGLTITSSEPVSPALLWVQRIATVFCGLFIILFTFNYRGIWKRFRIDRLRSNLQIIPAVLAVDIIVPIIIIIIFAMLSSIFGI